MSIGLLYDDLLLHLAKYLSPRDHLAFALSGENERFSVLYGTNREKLVLSECYFLSNKSWKRFFKDYISPSSITVCDVSHCYWLKAKVLLRCITKMPNLEELHIEDTRMSLKKMPQVFEACQKIVKLSLTLKEDNLDEFKKGVIEKSSLKWMKKGFKKITHLKLFTFVVPSGYAKNYNTWIAVVGVLRWCRDCIDLLIKTTFKEPTDGQEDTDAILEEQRKLWKKLKPRYAWMKTLKSLVILGDPRFQDYFTQQFLDWVRKIQGGRFDLERVWTTQEHFSPFDLGPLGFFALIELMNGPKVKSFAMYYEDWEGNFNELDDEHFSTLEHLAEIEFHKTIQRFENLTELKYIRGEFYVEDLDEILKCHEKLDQLHVFIKLRDNEAELNYIRNLEDWELHLLKDLVIWCNDKPSQGLLDHLMKASPNIDRVHFRFYHESLSRVEVANFFTSIRFNQLTWLDITLRNLFDGSNLVTIVKNCPKLERLFLYGSIEANTFFVNLSECILTAHNLRDLRVQWSSLQEYVPDLIAFFKALKRCPTLERLVLYAMKDNWKRDPIYMASLQDVILQFVKGMPHLVALCLVSFPVDSCFVKQLIDEIVPNRPSFWFHLGSRLPNARDLSIPRIHYEGIVNPINPYYAPPRF